MPSRHDPRPRVILMGGRLARKVYLQSEIEETARIESASPESDPWIRPERFTDAPAGYRVAVVDELQLPDSGWELGGEGRACRRLSRPACPNPSVATLGRGSKTPQRWGYCAEHLYGRHLEDGRLLTTVLVVDKAPNV